jgi:hypothetical protein
MGVEFDKSILLEWFWLGKYIKKVVLAQFYVET